jgi:hypothetical protein
MIVSIVLIIIAIIAYFLYENLTSTKFKKATILQKNGIYQKAQGIYLKIAKKHPLAITNYARCFYEQGEASLYKKEKLKAISFFNKVVDSENLLEINSDRNSFNKILSKSYFSIAQIQFSNIQKAISHEAIVLYNKNLEYINKSGFEELEDFKKLIIQHKSIIANIYYHLGLEDEKKLKIIDAKELYTNAKELYVNDYDELYYNSLVRIEICKLKINENTSDKVNFIKMAKKEFQIDYYYRYAIWLIKKHNYFEAEKIIARELDNRRADVKRLSNICCSLKIKFANNKIKEINDRITEINDGVLSTEETLKFYESISVKVKELSAIIPEITVELENIRPSIFNRLLLNMIENEQYYKIIKLILKYPDFYSSPPLLKNLSNACLNYVKNNKLAENNFKIIIALFLTSTFSDSVLLYSIEETIWDDEYTFTLLDSIGSSYQIHSSLPENVNYDMVSDSNISIGDSQRYLISQFENILNEQDISDEFAQEIYEFYTEEKYVIERIIELIPNEIFFTTPYFAKYYYSLNNIILSELENVYVETDDEEALQIGLLYNFNDNHKNIKLYSKVKEISNNIISNISNLNLSSFKKQIDQSNLELLRKFSTINDAFETELEDSLTEASKANPEDETLLDIMYHSIRIMKSKDNIKYMYSHYASNLCICKINSEKMTHFHGLKIMEGAYYALPNDTRICANIISLIRMNLMDILNNNTQYFFEIISTLDRIKKRMSITFINNSGEFIETRNSIIKQLPLDVRNALSSGFNLNEYGRKLKMVIEYLDILSGLSTEENSIASFTRRWNL